MKSRIPLASVIRCTAAMALLPVVVATGTNAPAALAAPPNIVQQWDEIAANTVVKSGAFQNEGFTYMAYVAAAVYDAVTSIEGGFKPYGPKVAAPAGASTDAAVVEAA